MAAMTPIDLSRLPAPNVVEPLDFETVFAELKASLLAYDPALEPVLDLESEPLTKLLQVFAYRELLLRNRVNQAARSVMVAYAVGADLEHLAALVGVQRLVLDAGDPANGVPPTLEGDDDLRRRVVLAPEGFSVAGPEGAYIFHALSADGGVLDASATSPNPGDVVVTVLARDGDGTAPAGLLATVAAQVGDEAIRPLTDNVTVQSAAVTAYTIEATIYTFAGPDPTIVLAACQAAAEKYAADNRRLGRDVRLSAVIAALHQPGVQRVELASPAADLVLDRTQAGFCSAIALTHGGLDE